MNILGIDTSSINATTALMIDDNIVTKEICDNNTHSQKLLPVIDELLNENSFNLKDVDFFACGVGPGSFTGLRIGIATIKAFAFANNKKVIGISTLDILANSVKCYEDTKYIVSIIDAKNDSVYSCIYKVDTESEPGFSPIFEPQYINIDNLLKYIVDTLFGNIIFVGTGTSIYNLNISSYNKPEFILAPEDKCLPSAKYLLELASKYDINSYVDPSSLLPLYLRPSQAERNKIGEL